MSPDEAKKKAVRFLAEQADIIKKYGKAPKLVGRNYRAALDDTTKLFQSLSAARKEKPST